MISNEPPQEAVGALPVSATIVELYATLYRRASGLAVRLGLPTVISIFFLFLAGGQLHPLFAYVLWYLFLALPMTLLGVSWLRLLLLGDNKTPFAVFSDFDERHRRFFKYSLLLSLITLPLVFLQYSLEGGAGAGEGQATNGDGGYTRLDDNPLSDLIYWAAYLPLFYIQLRLSFVLPAIAVGETYGFAESWRHTRKQHWPLFLIAVIAVLGPWVVWYYSPAWSDAPLWQLVTFVIYHFSIFLHQGAFYALLAIAFRTCTGWVPAPNRNIIERFE